MNEFYIRNVIEAALLAAGKPLPLAEIGQIFDENTRPKVDDLRAAIDQLAADYSSRGIEVKETAAGFRIQVRREFSAEISRLWPERPAKYSRALLETLALIAYRQPITRAEIEAVRGVAVNPNIIKTVIERNWVRVVGHRDVPGRPELLGTTREFLDYFGLRSLDELPPLAELKAMGDYNLQLELPSGVTLDGQPKVEGEAGAAVAGLLASDAAANGDDASAADPNAVAGGAESVAHDAGANTDIVGDADAHDHGASDAVAHTTADPNGAEALHDTGSPDHSVADAVAHTAASSNGAEGLHDADTHDHGASDAVAHTTADPNGAERLHDAGAPDHSVADAVAHTAADPDGAESLHDADAHDHGATDAALHTTRDSGGTDGLHDAGAPEHSVAHAVAHTAADSNSAGDPHGAAHDHGAAGAAQHVDATAAARRVDARRAADADSAAEAERTLAAGDVANHSSVESDDSDMSVDMVSGESSDSLDDAADDDADEDELSADGHGSRELVAAPPDLDD